VDLSRSMNVSDLSEHSLGPSIESERTNPRRRIDLALGWLLGDAEGSKPAAGWLERLKSNFRLELSGIQSTAPSNLSRIWLSDLALPQHDEIRAESVTSPIGSALSAACETNPAAIVVITDGQNNQGPSLVEASHQLAEKGIPLFLVGVGNSNEPNDLAVIDVTHSEQVYRTDLARGTIVLKQRVPAGTNYQVAIERDGQIVWTKRFESDDQAIRRLEFEFPAETLLPKTANRKHSGKENSATPIDLAFFVRSSVAELSTQNNRMQSSLWCVERLNRVLVLDQDGGWESRYIKNAFQRDPAWETSVVIGRTEVERDFLPPTRSKLMEYDLVIMTEATASQFSVDQRSWLSEFVSIGGGGLILIGSPNSDANWAKLNMLSELMPVRKSTDRKPIAPRAIRLTAMGNSQPAFRLSDTLESNQRLWTELKPPKSTRSVVLEPGAECLIEAVVNDNLALPLVATKLFGQGRVVYMASDETWRWRFKVADLHHQRFWNQLATWTMRTPFSINDTYASLDTGPRKISPNTQVIIRAKLKDLAEKPLEGALLQANIVRNGAAYLSIHVPQDRGIAGFYSTTLESLPTGRYQVALESVNLPKEALSIVSDFVVQEESNLETESLACNLKEMQEAAVHTGGYFATLAQAEEITDKLKPFRTGKTIETRSILWQSFPWFATIVGLLATELFLRKRAGLA
ncbi:MAG: VWA domain-containing protein, partial [Pirellula sp.]